MSTCSSFLYLFGITEPIDNVASRFRISAGNITPFPGSDSDYLASVQCSCTTFLGVTKLLYMVNYTVQDIDVGLPPKNISDKYFSDMAWTEKQQNPVKLGDELQLGLGCGCPIAGWNSIISYAPPQNDALSKITQKFNSDQDTIQSLNNIQNPNIIRTRRVLFIPSQQTPTSSPPANGTAPNKPPAPTPKSEVKPPAYSPKSEPASSIPSGPPKLHGSEARLIRVIIPIIIIAIVVIFGLLITLVLYILEYGCFAPKDKVENFLKQHAHETPIRYSFRQLKKATNNFREKLGEGAFGTVSKGKLSNGFAVAVKVLRDRSSQSEEQFMNEVGTIGRIHHINLVRLLGYCAKGSKRALVYEFMANGSLDNLIFPNQNGRALGWEQLRAIALGTARGIAYLHGDCQNRIIHYDIKPANVLVDENFLPKVADFGLAMLCNRKDTHVSMNGPRGTPGFAAPEVWSRSNGPVTEKCDVYSFGMLVLEMVGGRKNLELNASTDSQICFPEWAWQQVERGELGNIFGGDNRFGDEGLAVRLTLVSLWCIQYRSNDRPSMSDVVTLLEGNAELRTPPNPFRISSANTQSSSSTSTETDH
eukprot:Gb_34169 [translate_table: standard]